MTDINAALGDIAATITRLEDRIEGLKKENERLHKANEGYKATAEKYMKLVGYEAIETEKSRSELFEESRFNAREVVRLRNELSVTTESYKNLRERVEKLEDEIPAEILTIQSLIDTLVERRLGHREAQDMFNRYSPEPSSDITILRDPSDGMYLARVSDGWAWFVRVPSPEGLAKARGFNWDQVTGDFGEDEDGYVVVFERKL